jgi:hypothetical protein
MLLISVEFKYFGETQNLTKILIFCMLTLYILDFILVDILSKTGDNYYDYFVYGFIGLTMFLCKSKKNG